jgi:hypothetical protein
VEFQRVLIINHSRVNIEIFKLLKDIQEIPAARSLDNRWYQEPVLLVDALGATCPIPLELANSWEVCKITAFLFIWSDALSRCLTQ